MPDDYPYIIESIRDVEHRLSKRRPYIVLGDEPRVSFYCAVDSHADDTWCVASFVLVEPEGVPAAWVESPHYPTRDGYGFWIGYRAGTKLIGDTPADKDDPSRFHDPEFRVSYNLRCKSCGLAVSRQSGTIQADLTKLQHAGHLEVPLRAYAASV